MSWWNPGSYIAEQRRDWYAVDCLNSTECYPSHGVDSKKRPATAQTAPASDQSSWKELRYA